MVKNPPANAENRRDAGLIPGSGRSPEGGHGNPLQYPGLENCMDRGAWRATVHGVTKIWTRLSNLAPKKELQRASFLCHVRSSEEAAACKSGRGVSAETDPDGTLILDFSLQNCEEVEF